MAPGDIIVRPATPADFDALVELHYGDPDGEAALLVGSLAGALAFGRVMLGHNTDWSTHDVAVVDGLVVGAVQHQGSPDAFRPSLGSLGELMRALGFASLKALPRGIGVLSAQLSVPDGCWHIAELHVQPSHRGRGIGSVLIARADQAARMHGRSCIGLTTRTNNPALRLYERLGYVVVRTKSSRLYERFTGAKGRVLMTKDLV